MSDDHDAEKAQEPFREMTVGDLIERLREMPEHRPVTIIVNETAGVITGVWEQKLNPDSGEAPHVLIGELRQVSPIVPPSWLPVSTWIGGHPMTTCHLCGAYASQTGYAPALKAMLCGFHARRLTAYSFDHPNALPTSWPDWRANEGADA